MKVMFLFVNRAGFYRGPAGLQRVAGLYNGLYFCQFIQYIGNDRFGSPVLLQRPDRRFHLE
jgi:hypothetical protein